LYFCGEGKRKGLILSGKGRGRASALAEICLGKGRFCMVKEEHRMRKKGRINLGKGGRKLRPSHTEELNEIVQNGLHGKVGLD